MTEKSKRKRALILEKSRELFREKGYTAVTMQDIVQACGISRGGVYVYFASVDEIFLEVIAQRNREKLESTWREAHDAGSFDAVLDGYFSRQKQRLMHIRHSLSLAMYEYCLSHSGEEYRSFFAGQMSTTKANVLEVLRCCGPVYEERQPELDALAAHIMFVIEGLTTLALFSGISEAEAESQFAILRGTIQAFFEGENRNE